MKIVIVFAALFAVALAAPANEAELLHLESDHHGDGYKFSYATSDGSSHQEEGHLINEGTEDEAIAVRGSFSFVADDGQIYTVNYIADENGFQPQGAHLPVSPLA